MDEINLFTNILAGTHELKIFEYTLHNLALIPFIHFQLFLGKILAELLFDNYQR